MCIRDSFNTMYADTKMPASRNYADDLTTKPFMQTLWAGKDADADPETLRVAGGGLSLFLGANSFMDYQVGRVMEIIDREFPDAVVMFTSDHGDMLGNHRVQMKNAAMYKEIANVPMIIRGGEKGKVVRAPASHIDIVPTVMEYMGLPIPRLLEGRSMMPQIRDTNVRINDCVYTEFTRYEVDHDGFGGLQMMRGVTDGRYKLVLHLCDTDELYDMEKDPDEVENRIHCTCLLYTSQVIYFFALFIRPWHSLAGYSLFVWIAACFALSLCNILRIKLLQAVFRPCGPAAAYDRKKLGEGYRNENKANKQQNPLFS